MSLYPDVLLGSIILYCNDVCTPPILGEDSKEAINQHCGADLMVDLLEEQRVDGRDLHLADDLKVLVAVLDLELHVEHADRGA